MNTRQSLKLLQESVNILVEYQDFGGDLEHAFNLHIDDDKLKRATELLDNMIIAIEDEGAKS